MERFRWTATNVLIAATFVAFLLQLNMAHGSAIMGMNRLFWEQGFLLQPLTSVFAHGGWMHILMNMAIFYHYGNLLENYMGKGRYLLLYLGGGVLTSIFSFFFTWFLLGWDVNLVGASGAICVLLGFIAVRDRLQRKEIVTMVLVISFLPLLAGMPVAWYAHLIGFGLGWLAGMLAAV